MKIFKSLPIGNLKSDAEFKSFKTDLRDARGSHDGRKVRLDAVKILAQFNEEATVEDQLDTLYRVYLLDKSLIGLVGGDQPIVRKCFNRTLLEIYAANLSAERWFKVIRLWVRMDRNLLILSLSELEKHLEFKTIKEAGKIIQRLNNLYIGLTPLLGEREINLFLRWKEILFLDLLPSFGRLQKTKEIDLPSFFSLFGKKTYLEDFIPKADIFPQDFFGVELNPQWKETLISFSKNPGKALLMFYEFAVSTGEPSKNRFTRLIGKGDLEGFEEFLPRLFFAVHRGLHFNLCLMRMNKTGNLASLLPVYEETSISDASRRQMIPRAMDLLTASKSLHSEEGKEVAYQMIARFFPYYLNLTYIDGEWKGRKFLVSSILAPLNLRDEDLKCVLDLLNIPHAQELTMTFDFKLFLHLTSCSVSDLLDKFPGIFLLNAFNVKEYSDIKLVVDKTSNKLFVHSRLLQRSDFFKGMFQGEFKESLIFRKENLTEITLTQEMFSFFQTWLPSIYDMWLSSPKIITMGTYEYLQHLYFAHYFQMPKVADMIDQILARSIAEMEREERGKLLEEAFGSEAEKCLDQISNFYYSGILLSSSRA
ncbi:MAG: BTB/POZ domain-containing protein [Chlamydiales bacterium]|nr:BTB/POZ domain-containing protein [Chlamydiales bacterium]